ncbi:class I SAM-dependent methyltransferase [Dapis sp. BLCC M229]|uniref:class I SAM-dependent methyltransferase n=1 Tax=Dapis sp. BLCC M229 TaxID=3400188 RepID=UPI003CF79884
MVKLGIPRTNDCILHFAPEKCLINLFSESHGEKYEVCDLFPEKYKNSKKTVRRLDICEDLYSMPSDQWDLILHNHVLEHLFCSVKGVLRGFDRILKPGGTMLFTIPVSSKQRTTTENLNPYLSDEERSKKFGQKDHVRIFGGDVIDLIQQALGVDCLVPVKSLFTQKELNMAGVQWRAEKEPHGQSIFLYRKN